MINKTFAQIQQSAARVFTELNELLQEVSSTEYTTPSKALSRATIGQHVRHIAEFFVELDKGYNSGTVNYEKRKRDYNVENNKEVALVLVNAIYAGLEKPNKNLFLEESFNGQDDAVMNIPTNYYREVAYNLEHAVHHMALIRIGVSDISTISLPESFGVAAATIKYRNACAQ
jgi:hypothetical protein